MDVSPAALVSKMTDALQTYSAQPHSQLAAEAAVRAARDLATGLNTAAGVMENRAQRGRYRYSGVRRPRELAALAVRVD